MTMTVLKHGGKWDLMEYLFVVKVATFYKRVTEMIKLLSWFIYRRFILSYGEQFGIDRQISDKITFKTFKMCRYATAVTFQQSFRPGGSLKEANKFFTG